VHSTTESSKRSDHDSLVIRRRILRALVCLSMAWVLAVASAQSAFGQSVYQYKGNPFNLFSCGPADPGPGDVTCSTPAPTNPLTSYDATDYVSATLTLTSPLGANLAYQDVRTFPGFQLTMNDGQHTVTNADAAGMFAEVSTDASGQINHWRLVINTGGALNGGIATINFTDTFGTHVFDQGVLACCSPTVVGDFAFIFGSSGTWNGGSGPAALVGNLINLISNPLLGLTSGQINSLTDKLNSVLASIQAGLNKQAINQLQAFINSVQTSLKTGKMSAQTAGTLITAANAIIAVL
jgi:hypothetical protein